MKHAIRSAVLWLQITALDGAGGAFLVSAWMVLDAWLNPSCMTLEPFFMATFPVPLLVLSAFLVGKVSSRQGKGILLIATLLLALLAVADPCTAVSLVIAAPFVILVLAAQRTQKRLPAYLVIAELVCVLIAVFAFLITGTLAIAVAFALGRLGKVDPEALGATLFALGLALLSLRTNLEVWKVRQVLSALPVEERGPHEVEEEE